MLYDDGYIGLTQYNVYGYNVFGIHKSWYYLYGQPVGVKITEREHRAMQQLVFGGEAPFDAQKRRATKLTHMIDPYGYEPSSGLHVLGYNEEGYDLFGYDRNGFNKEGYNKVGYSKYGVHKRGYEDGFDINGLTKSWQTIDGVRYKLYAPHGYQKDGYNIFGFNEYGYDRQGYNMSGYNTLGINREGRFIGENM